MVVDLAEVGVLAVTGDRDHARSWARTLMNQLAAWRAPHDLRLLTAFEPEDAEAWEWGKWLPHQRVDPNVPGRFLFARSMDELDALLEPELRPRLEQLRRIAEADVRRPRDAAGGARAGRDPRRLPPRPSGERAAGLPRAAHARPPAQGAC